MDSELSKRNKNRGYQTLRVWQDAIEYYRLSHETFKSFPYETKRVASQQIACVDSVHRNIAEGYGRRSLKEYIQYLYIALGSLAESVSGLIAYKQTNQITPVHFKELDSLAFRIENGMINLISRLEEKKDQHNWVDHLHESSHMLRETNDLSDLFLPNTPSLQHSS